MFEYQCFSLDLAVKLIIIMADPKSQRQSRGNNYFCMKVLNINQLDSTVGGDFWDAAACIGGIAGFAALFIGASGTAGPIGAWAACEMIADWIASGVSMGAGCGNWIASMMNKE